MYTGKQQTGKGQSPLSYLRLYRFKAEQNKNETDSLDKELNN